MWKGLKKLIFNTDIDDISEEGTLSDIELPKKEKKKLLEDKLKERIIVEKKRSFWSRIWGER